MIKYTKSLSVQDLDSILLSTVMEKEELKAVLDNILSIATQPDLPTYEYDDRHRNDERLVAIIRLVKKGLKICALP